MKAKNYATKLFIILLLAVFLNPNPGASQTTRSANDIQRDYAQGTIVIKVKEGLGPFEKQNSHVSFGISSLDKKAQEFSVNKLEKRFQHKPIARSSGLPDLSRIYRIEFPASYDVHQVANEFSKDPYIEYAEAVPVAYAAELPNDPLYGSQQHLPQIMAAEAWDVHKGEDGEEVVIAIVDSGADWLHPDLIENTWQNLGEDADGDGVTLEFNDGVWERDPDDLNDIDDDGNGFVDDVIGWDFLEAQTIGDGSNPGPSTFDDHGTHCAGIAAARTNNGLGISSVSYNVKYMPLQISNQSAYYVYGYDGIIYAAENGADIISNSWAGYGSSQANQEVIDYAVGLGSIVLAAAGNNGSDTFQYPAAYFGVISVSAVYPDDTRHPLTNYGAFVDIVAPGVDILSTVFDSNYEAYSGTSMSSPMVAGLFGLLKSYRPDWSNEDLITQVLGTADNVDPLSPGFENAQGSGRINAYRALVEENVELPQEMKLGFIDLTLNDENFNGAFEAGEIVTVSFNMRNFSSLGDEDATFTLSSTDPDITIAIDSKNLSIPGEGDFGAVNAFIFEISETATVHETSLLLKVSSDVEIAIGGDIEIPILLAPSGILVWEGHKHTADYSGTFINEFLTERGHPVTYTNHFPTSLWGFDATFLSFGNGTTRMIPEIAAKVKKYLQNGGYVYLEGGDALGFDRRSDSQLHALFGLSAATDGNDNPINSLSGQNDALTSGMLFTNSSQVQNRWIDIYTPLPTKETSFIESDYGNVAVQNSVEDGRKSFCFSYALAYLEDENPHSSRDNLMYKMMDFFGYAEGNVLANFKSDITEGEPGFEAHFTDWSVTNDNSEIDSWEWDFNEDGEIDSYGQNPVWTFANSGIYDVMLIVSNGNDHDTLIRDDFIKVRSGILVYEGVENENGYSGTFIKDYLENHWYDEVAYTNSFPQSLDGYDAVFLSFGNTGLAGTMLSQEMVDAISDYGSNGGHIYLEGGDALAFNSTLGTVFGLSSSSNGQENLLQNLTGHNGSIMQGITINNSLQQSQRSVDTYAIADDGTAIVAFEEGFYGNVAVEYHASERSGQKAFCMSYALANLEDGDGEDTRNEILKRILNFFDVVADVNEVPVSTEDMINVFPNPTSGQMTVSGLPANSNIQLTDLSGNLIMTLKADAGDTKLGLSELPKGIYLLRTEVGTKKIVKM